MTIVSSKLCFFLLPVCVEIQTYCGCGFVYVIERTPTPAPCLLAVWLLRVPTHIATVLVFLHYLGITAWERNGRNKRIVLECSGIPRRILFFAASISRKTFLSLEQMLELNVRYEWQVLPPNTHRSPFSTSHSCVYSVLRHITWKLQFICGRSAYRTTAILSESFFMWFRVALEIQLESYSSRHASVVLWNNIVCIYCKPTYTSLFGTQLGLTKLTYLMTAYYTPSNSFTANNASFHKNKVGWLHCTLQRLFN